jgi:thiol-disulfide isomerase/thioredoxin
MMTAFMASHSAHSTMHACISRRSLILALAGAFLALPVLAKDVTLLPWPTGQATPALDVVDLDGKPFDIRSLRGKVVVVNFWASWCAPCVAELPVLGRLAARNDLAVVGVNYKEGMNALKGFTDSHPLPYPVVRDRGGDAFKLWSPGVMPTTILLDRLGRARWRTVGEIPADDTGLARAIEGLLAEAPAAPNKQ